MYIKEKRMTSWCHSAWAGAGMFYSEEMQLLVVFYDLLVSYPVYSYPAVVRVKPKVKKTSEARVSAGGRGGPSRRIQWKCSVSTSRTSSTSSIGTVTERPAQSPPCSGTGRGTGARTRAKLFLSAFSKNMVVSTIFIITNLGDSVIKHGLIETEVSLIVNILVRFQQTRN